MQTSIKINLGLGLNPDHESLGGHTSTRDLVFSELKSVIPVRFVTLKSVTLKHIYLTLSEYP